MTGGSSFSLLSRGIGNNDEQQKVVVDLEAQDYFNLVVKQPTILSDTQRHFKPARISRTFTTRKGALFIFAERKNNSERPSQNISTLLHQTGNVFKSTQSNREDYSLSFNQPSSRNHDVAMTSSAEAISLNTLQDLTHCILNYGAKDASSVHLRCVPTSSSGRVTRPGLSARRYLASMTRHMDSSLVHRLIQTGRICESTLYQQNSVLPYMKRRINDDLSLLPTPYRIMKSMLLCPGPLNDFSFVWSKKPTFIDDDDSFSCENATPPPSTNLLLGPVADHSGLTEGAIAVLHRSSAIDGVREEREIDYSSLNIEEKKEVLSSLLVKSVITSALSQQDALLHDTPVSYSARDSPGKHQTIHMMDAVKDLLNDETTKRLHPSTSKTNPLSSHPVLPPIQESLTLPKISSVNQFALDSLPEAPDLTHQVLHKSPVKVEKPPVPRDLRPDDIDASLSFDLISYQSMSPLPPSEWNSALFHPSRDYGNSWSPGRLPPLARVGRRRGDIEGQVGNDVIPEEMEEEEDEEAEPEKVTSHATFKKFKRRAVHPSATQEERKMNDSAKQARQDVPSETTNNVRRGSFFDRNKSSDHGLTRSSGSVPAARRERVGGFKGSVQEMREQGYDESSTDPHMESVTEADLVGVLADQAHFVANKVIEGCGGGEDLARDVKHAIGHIVTQREKTFTDISSHLHEPGNFTSCDLSDSDENRHPDSNKHRHPQSEGHRHSENESHRHLDNEKHRNLDDEENRYSIREEQRNSIDPTHKYSDDDGRENQYPNDDESRHLDDQNFPDRERRSPINRREIDPTISLNRDSFQMDSISHDEQLFHQMDPSGLESLLLSNDAESLEAMLSSDDIDPESDLGKFVSVIKSQAGENGVTSESLADLLQSSLPTSSSGGTTSGPNLSSLMSQFASAGAPPPVRINRQPEGTPNRDGGHTESTPDESSGVPLQPGNVHSDVPSDEVRTKRSRPPKTEVRVMEGNGELSAGVSREQSTVVPVERVNTQGSIKTKKEQFLVGKVSEKKDSKRSIPASKTGGTVGDKKEKEKKENKPSTKVKNSSTSENQAKPQALDHPTDKKSIKSKKSPRPQKNEETGQALVQEDSSDRESESSDESEEGPRVEMNQEVKPEIAEQDEPESHAKKPLPSIKVHQKSVKDSLSMPKKDNSDEMDTQNNLGVEADLTRRMSVRDELEWKRRQEAERRRKEQEEKRHAADEARRRAEEEAEAADKMNAELQQEREEKDRLFQQKLDREREAKEARRRAAEEKELAKQRALEKDKRDKAMMQAKMEEIRKKKEEELVRKREADLIRKAEEEERQRIEDELIATMGEEERAAYLKLKAEREEQERKTEEENRLRREREAREALATAQALSAQMAQAKADLAARLRFVRGLVVEKLGLERDLSISPAFVWSYFNLLTWLGFNVDQARLANFKLD